MGGPGKKCTTRERKVIGRGKNLCWFKAVREVHEVENRPEPEKVKSTTGEDNKPEKKKGQAAVDSLEQDWKETSTVTL